MTTTRSFAACFLRLFLAFSVIAAAPAAEKPDAAPAAAEEKTTDPDVSPPEETTTAHAVVIGGNAVDYTVKTGFTPVHSEDGEEDALIFSTSYLAFGNDRERPVLFLYNGGPGSASIYVHIGAFGPRAFPAVGPGLTIPAPPYRVADNPDSLLDVVDLVFIDPVDTGYSHAADTMKSRKEDEKKAEKADFWSTETDIQSMAEFIRVWLIENDRWGSPVFVGGESYGGLRTAGLAKELSEIGVAPTGLILISPVVSYMDLEDFGDNNQGGSALLLPTFAAVAHYHGRLDPDLQALARDRVAAMAEEWSENTYLPALRRGNRLAAADRERVNAGLARFTGLDRRDIDAMNLVVDQFDFCSFLLRGERRFLSAYDGRMVAPGAVFSFAEDPLFTLSGEPYMTAFLRYLTEDLGLKTKRKYNFSSPNANKEWDFINGSKGKYGYPSTVNDLARTMRRLPFLRVFNAVGRYDMVTPPESSMHSLARMDIPADRVADITHRMYEGGHMMYTNAAAKKRLAEDLRAWIAGK